MSASKPFVIGIAGETARGKTPLAQALGERVSHLPLAAFPSGKPPEERPRRNDDPPGAFDLSLYLDHVRAILVGILYPAKLRTLMDLILPGGGKKPAALERLKAHLVRTGAL